MGKMKNYIRNEDMIWTREWFSDSISVGDMFLLEEDSLAEYVGEEGGLALMLIVDSLHTDYIGKKFLYNYSRLIKVPKGSQLPAARILYGK